MLRFSRFLKPVSSEKLVSRPLRYVVGASVARSSLDFRFFCGSYPDFDFLGSPFILRDRWTATRFLLCHDK